MKNIAVLIDFTEGSKMALIQGAGFARRTNANLFAVHIIPSQDKLSSAEGELNTFIQHSGINDIAIKPLIGIGALAHAANTIFNKIDADLVIVCTHGIRGMFQQLFGAQILKLVQAISYPCLVISEHTKVDLSKANSILFPVGPHPDFFTKIKQTGNLSKLLNASVVIYEIDRSGADSEDLLNKNIENAKEYFIEHQIPYKKVIEELKAFSVGFSRQTMDYAIEQEIPILSMMATVSKNDTLYGFGDKETFLVNDKGLAILTCNA